MTAEPDKVFMHVHAGNNQTTSVAIFLNGAKGSNSALVLAIVIPVAILIAAAAAASLLWMQHSYVPMQ